MRPLGSILLLGLSSYWQLLLAPIMALACLLPTPPSYWPHGAESPPPFGCSPPPMPKSRHSRCGQSWDRRTRIVKRYAPTRLTRCVLLKSVTTQIVGADDGIALGITREVITADCGPVCVRCLSPNLIHNPELRLRKSQVAGIIRVKGCLQFL